MLIFVAVALQTVEKRKVILLAMPSKEAVVTFVPAIFALEVLVIIIGNTMVANFSSRRNYRTRRSINQEDS